MASTPIQIRFTPEELAGIDHVRGGLARGTWIKSLCRSAVAAHEGLVELRPETASLGGPASGPHLAGPAAREGEAAPRKSPRRAGARRAAEPGPPVAGLRIHHKRGSGK